MENADPKPPTQPPGPEQEPGIYPGQNAPEIPRQPEPDKEFPVRRGTPEREIPHEPPTLPGHNAPEIPPPEIPQHDAPPVLS